MKLYILSYRGHLIHHILFIHSLHIRVLRIYMQGIHVRLLMLHVFRISSSGGFIIHTLFNMSQ